MFEKTRLVKAKHINMSNSEIDEAINQWLQDNDVYLVDIKMSVGLDRTDVLIIYQERSVSEFKLEQLKGKLKQYQSK